MSQGWKITVIVAAAAGVVSTPLLWLLNSPDTGQLVGASVQGAVAIGTLVWALFQQPAAGPAPVSGPVDVAVATGKATATDGGDASTGVRRPAGAGSGSATAERTGDATADGAGSSASTGIDYS
ncbi:hypothetical protein [Streptomyces niveus]|uniref:hypothetical protein n=1 Tax=Streptomyces niveus TaxID=193462 RepID=UPI0036D25C9C